MSRRTLDIRKVLDIRKTLDIRRTLNPCKTPNIRRILPLLDDHNGTHGVSEAREDKASRPVLDAKEVTVSLSMNVKA